MNLTAECRKLGVELRKISNRASVEIISLTNGTRLGEISGKEIVESPATEEARLELVKSKLYGTSN